MVMVNTWCRIKQILIFATNREKVFHLRLQQSDSYKAVPSTTVSKTWLTRLGSFWDDARWLWWYRPAPLSDLCLTLSTTHVCNAYNIEINNKIMTYIWSGHLPCTVKCIVKNKSQQQPEKAYDVLRQLSRTACKVWTFLTTVINVMLFTYSWYAVLKANLFHP